MKRIVQLFTLILFSLSITACGGSSLEGLAESMLYPFKDVDKKYPVPEVAPEGYKAINLPALAADGTTMNINGWVYKSNNPNTSRFYIHFHGNGENLQALHQFNFLAKMKEFNSHFLVIDYPGLGRSTGSPNEANLVSGALAAIDWVKANYPNMTIIVWGRSLGAAVAVQATAKRQSIIHGLTLTSPWNNMLDMARNITKLVDQLPKSWLEKNKYDSVAAAKMIHTTTLIHHGIEDTLIPIRFGREVFASFPEPDNVMMVEFPGLGHNDIFSNQQLWSDIKNFIR